MMLLCLIITLCLIRPVYPQPGRVSLGPAVMVTGEPFRSANNPKSTGYGYYGIRYGKAKRFEAPTENTDFLYLRNSSRLKQGPICPQRPMPKLLGTLSANDVMDEDCLYLDVYVPPVGNDQARLPVMMWIYGGGLQAGDKNNYNASVLADDISAIIVTINYRVSIFGFLSTGDTAAAGNYGLADSKLAVQWVKKNIAKFGGDQNAITVFGESAGALLTSAMQLDPLIQSSIRAAIAFSGSVLLDADYIRDPKKDATELAVSVGCPTRSSNELVTCLKRMSVQKLLSAAKGFEEGNPNITPYAFVLDHVHFKDAPRKALEAAIRSANRGPHYITGYLREDFSFLLAIANPDVFDPKKPLTLATIKQIVAYGFLPNGNIPQCAEPNYELAQKVMDRYNMTAKDSRSSLLLKLFHLTTDVVFAYPAAKESQMYTRRQGSAANANQMFRISYDPKYNDFGAFHTYDLPNMFSPAMQLPNLRLNPRVVSSIRSMLRQVAHNGGNIWSWDSPEGGKPGCMTICHWLSSGIVPLLLLALLGGQDSRCSEDYETGSRLSTKTFSEKGGPLQSFECSGWSGYVTAATYDGYSAS